MSGLLIFGRFAHDPQGVLTAVEGLTIMGLKRSVNLGFSTVELRATSFADGEILFHDPQFSLRHEDSLAPNACANETAPVPIDPTISPTFPLGV